MKLRNTFSLVVFAAIIQVVLLTLLMLLNSSRIQEMKQYQHKQVQVKQESGRVIKHLTDTELREVHIGGIYDDWKSLVSSVDGSYLYDFNDGCYSGDDPQNHTQTV